MSHFKVKCTDFLLPTLFILFSFYVHLFEVQIQSRCTALVIETGEVFSNHMRDENCIENFNQKRYHLGDQGVD